MEISELAEIMNRRFDDVEERLGKMDDAREKFSESCRIRHTDVDNKVTALKERQSFIGVLTVAFSAAIAALMSFIRGG